MGFIQENLSRHTAEVVTWDAENGLLMNAEFCGHYYTKAELLRLRAYIDKSLGNIEEKGYNIELHNKNVYEQFCEQMRNHTPTPKSDKPSKPSWVYLAYDGHTGYWKIGVTTNLKAREKTLKLSNAKISIRHSFGGDYSVEKLLHVRFAPFKIQGEWFCLNDEHIKNILSTCK